MMNSSPNEALVQREAALQVKEKEISAIYALFSVTARILAVRLFLFLSLLGSFALAIMATLNQSTLSTWIIGVFALVTTLPFTILELKNKRGG